MQIKSRILEILDLSCYDLMVFFLKIEISVHRIVSVL